MCFYHILPLAATYTAAPRQLQTSLHCSRLLTIFAQIIEMLMKKFLYLAAAAAFLSLCACRQKPEAAEPPVILLDFEGDLQLAPEGGEESFGYVVESPVEGGRLEIAEPEEDWVHDFQVSEEDNTVSFAVYANGTGDDRSTEIRLSYIYGENKVETGFTAVQAAGPEIWVGTPDVVVRDEVVPADGGEYSVLYYINYPRDGVVSMTCDDKDWVHDVELDVENTRVNFTVDPNTGGKREFTVTLAYTYEGGRDEQSFTVTQVAADSEGPTVERVMEYAMGAYNGTDRTYLETAHEYILYMSSKPFSVPDEYGSASASYDVHLYAAAPADPGAMLPPAGTYGSSGAITPDVFILEFRDIFGDWHSSFENGTLTLGYDDSGDMTVEILATDGETGDVHKVTFTGPVAFTDIREQ